MEKQNYSIWLIKEAATVRYALLCLFEKRDELLYREAPALRTEYMVKIGAFEEEVIAAELDVAMLERKINLIQTAINQRRPIDLDGIEKRLQEERESRLASLEAADRTASESPALSSEEQDELQKKYRQIIHDFHPQVNKDISETQKGLYEKAVDAYKRQNLDALRIIHDLLYMKEDPVEVTATAAEATEEEKNLEKEIQEIADVLTADYSLAADLFRFFAPSETDAVFLSSIQSLRSEYETVEKEIAEIMTVFPFNAKDTIRNQKKTDEYLSELKARLKKSEDSKAELSQKITEMLGAVQYGR